MNIEVLTQLESSIQKRMPEAGYFEERDKYLQQNEIYEEWRGVFEKYVNLALNGNMEALKRSVFFLWYQFSEPCQLSGLLDLNEHLTQSILNRVNTLSETNSLDTELEFMLPFYFQVCDWYFERFSNMDELINASHKNSDLWETEAPKQKWENRGIMGEYWASKGL